MSITININIPAALAADAKALGTVTGLLAKPNDPETNLIPLQGPPISMLLFALTRAATIPGSQQLMSPLQDANLKSNRALYDIFKGTGAGATPTGKNGIDVFKNFIAQHPQYLQTLHDAQAMYVVFRQSLIDGGIWGDTCDLKFSQLANMAQIDWLGL